MLHCGSPNTHQCFSSSITFCLLRALDKACCQYHFLRKVFFSVQVHQFPLSNPQHKITLSTFVFGFVPPFSNFSTIQFCLINWELLLYLFPTDIPKLLLSPLALMWARSAPSLQPSRHRTLSTGHFCILAFTRLCEKSFSAACWDLTTARDYFNTSQAMRIVRPGAKRS